LQSELVELRRLLSVHTHPFHPHRRYLLLQPHTGPPGLHRVAGEPQPSPLHTFAAALCRTGGSMYPRPQPVGHALRLAAVDEVVHEQDRVLMFEGRMRQVNNLRATGGAHFNQQTSAMSASQLLVLQCLRESFHERSVVGGAGGVAGSSINTLYCFHGPRREHVESICANGLVAVSAMDAGFFGSGCYTTLNIEYAARYARGDFDQGEPRPAPADGRFAVIMFAACVGMAYPITPEKDYSGAVPGVPAGHSDYFGRPLKPGFNGHCACVSEGSGMQAVSREHCQL